MILTGVSTGDGAEAVLEQGEERGEQGGRVGDTEPEKGYLPSRNRKKRDPSFGGWEDERAHLMAVFIYFLKDWGHKQWGGGTG